MCLKKERTAHRIRIKSLLNLHGVCVASCRQIGDFVAACKIWNGQSVPAELRSELDREIARLELIGEQIRTLEKEQMSRVADPRGSDDLAVRKLMSLHGIGMVGAWVLHHEFFAWRNFQNRREVGAAAGLTPTPYDSGASIREQGINKAGNRRVRSLMAELSWRWLTLQPQSALSRWYWERFGHGKSRLRRVGLVALARKLLIALWKYATFDEVPEGAVVKKRLVIRAC